MLRNYFYLLRATAELEPLLLSARCTEAYSQEKDCLVIKMLDKNGADLSLLISVNPQKSHLVVKNNLKRAKKNSISFFENIFPLRIKTVSMALNERIMRFGTDKGSLYWIIRGNLSNLLYADEGGNIAFFKKVEIPELETLSIELKNLVYVRPEDYPAVKENIIEQKTHPFLGKETFMEIKASCIQCNRVSVESITNEILGSPISVFYDKTNRRVRMLPESFSIYGAKDICEKYRTDSYLDAAGKFIAMEHAFREENSLRTEIGGFLEKTLSRGAERLNVLKGRLGRENLEEEYRRIGNLLLSNFHLIKPGIDRLNLTDYSRGQTEEVSLDPKLSASKNVENYFSKAKSQRKSIEASAFLYEKYQAKYNFFLRLKEEYIKASGTRELNDIKVKAGIRNSAAGKNMETGNKFRKFLIENKYELYVGKDSANNDLLTCKFAKSNDYWFHARAVPGSHAVLRNQNSSEKIPRPVLKAAASVAAFYSKAKTSKLAPVSFTQKKYVIKRKGLDPGQVILTREEVLMVRPGIPVNCLKDIEDEA